MTDCQSELLSHLVSRGFMHQCTNLDALDAAAAKGPVTAYIGFDCTADTLHVGSLVQLMLLRTMARFGHRPIALVGGGTTKVGDPSGKDESRRMLTHEDIASNANGIRKVMQQFIPFGDGPGKAIMLDNDEWLSGLAYVDFLRDYGKHFTINRMLTFDSVKLRLDREQPLTFLEFNYMIMQAYDFLELYRRENCVLQLGGSDQWGNIVNGVELVRRVEGGEAYGFTTPLITTASGAKMGKTAAGAVWLDPDKLSPFDYWQFWRNTEDADVGRFLRLFTELPLEEITRLEKLEGAELNDAKAQLADACTAMAHGDEAAKTARAAAQGQFGVGGDLSGLPHVEVALTDLQGDQIAVVDLFVASGLVKSKGEARRLIRGKGAKLDDQVVSDENAELSRDGLPDKIKLSSGKKRHIVVEMS